MAPTSPPDGRRDALGLRDDQAALLADLAAGADDALLAAARGWSADRLAAEVEELHAVLGTGSLAEASLLWLGAGRGGRAPWPTRA